MRADSGYALPPLWFCAADLLVKHNMLVSTVLRPILEPKKISCTQDGLLLSNPQCWAGFAPESAKLSTMVQLLQLLKALRESMARARDQCWSRYVPEGRGVAELTTLIS
jgi:hypothetical protein